MAAVQLVDGANLLPPHAQGCGFTKAQLHVLERQIDGMHRISVRLKALKYKARTGLDLQPAGGGSQFTRAPAVFGIVCTRKLGGRALAGKPTRDVPGGKRGSKRGRCAAPAVRLLVVGVR